MQAFINRCLRKILRIRWPETITNEELWERTGQKPLDRQIKKRKWSWIGHTLRKPSGITEKDALDWNPQGKRRRGRPKKTWKRTVEEEARDEGKRWQEVKAVAENKRIRIKNKEGVKGVDDDDSTGDMDVCQVEVSATGRSLVQRSPAYCGVSLCVIWKPQE